MKPKLQYEYSYLPELEFETGIQRFELDFFDEANNTFISADVEVLVENISHDGDGYITPRTTDMESYISGIDVKITDENGKLLKDEDKAVEMAVKDYISSTYEF